LQSLSVDKSLKVLNALSGVVNGDDETASEQIFAPLAD
jgi:hypothetical protein